MNLYLVISEPLENIEWVSMWDEIGIRNSYRIVNLVVAKSHAQARYLAWRADKDGDTWPLVEDMPKFAVRLKRHNVRGPARVLTPEDAGELWRDARVWDIGSAPNIGIDTA